MTDANRIDNSASERRLAVEALAEARYLVQGGFDRAAAVRAYYAEIVTRLAYLREASDYATDRVVTREEAGEAVSLAEKFLRATGIEVE